MELRRYLSILRGRLLLILLTTVLAAGVGYFSADTTPRYTARSTLYVGSTTFDISKGEILTGDRVLGLQSIALTFSKMIDSAPIALRAIKKLDLDLGENYVVSATHTTQEPGTQLIYVDVTLADPRLAQSLANGLSDAFVEAVQEFEPGSAQTLVPHLPAYVFQRAQLPTTPHPNERASDTLLAALFGLVASGGVAFLLDYLDLSVRTAADVERHLDLPVLGVIPDFGGSIPPNEWFGARLQQKSGG